MFQMIHTEKKYHKNIKNIKNIIFASKICAFDRRNFFQYYKTLKSLEI